MLVLVIEFTNLLLAALVVGAMFGVWLVFNPAGLDAGFYIALHQQGVRTLNRKMPALGAVTTLLTIVAAALCRADAMRLSSLTAAAVCFAASGLITRFLNQPINAVVMTWSADSSPQNWTALRDKWWLWHRIRTVSGIVGLCLLIASMLAQG